MLPLSWEWKKRGNVLQSGLGHSLPLSLSLRNSAGLAHVFRVEAYRFCWALQKAAAGLHWWVFKSRGRCTKAAGPRTQKFPSRVLSWSVQSSADESLVACPAQEGQGLTGLSWSHPRRVMPPGGWSLSTGCGERQWVRLRRQVTCWRNCPLSLSLLPKAYLITQVRHL